MAQTYEFQAEAKQLLSLVINSIYSNKDIFLRELISNASDAMDKLRLRALTDSDLQVDTEHMQIRLVPNTEARTLSVVDSGIGMNDTELRELIGTIARSGTAEFISKLKNSQSESHSADLIGQFGVGFYSVFMVAEKVTIETRKAGETQAYRWESDGNGSFTIEEIEGDRPQGTAITLQLKKEDTEDGIADYTSEWVLRDLVKKYSDFISYPVVMKVTHKHEDEVHEEDETLNSMKALWARNPDEVEKSEYNEFYKHVAHDWCDPRETIAFKGEGTFEFQSLLFIPEHASPDLYTADFHKGVQLYVKRVFIMDRCEELLPDYLRFVRGVVDAEDLSLNVSRELLQKDRQIRAINKGITRKVLSVLGDMKKDRLEDYKKFWNEFGRIVKEGLVRAPEQKKALLDLVLLPSTHSQELTSLEDYVGRMPEGQDAIYYITGENRAVMENSPHLEAFREKGYEVLLLQDSVDPFWVDMISDYKEKEFKSVLRSDVSAGNDDEKKAKEEKLNEQKKDLASLLSWMGSSLSEQVKEVRLSSRLTSSPACLVADSDAPSPAMEKMMKAMGHEMPPVKRVLELNGDHPLVTRLHELYEEKHDDAELKSVVEVLYSQALLAEGGELPDPSRFSQNLTALLTKVLSK